MSRLSIAVFEDNSNKTDSYKSCGYSNARVAITADHKSKGLRNKDKNKMRVTTE